MAMNKEEYALKLMPDFEVFDIVEREFLKNEYLLNILSSSSGIIDLCDDFSYISIQHKDSNHKIPIPWHRFALRSTRELKIDETLSTDTYSFIKVTNPPDKFSNYFYYVFILHTDYIEKKQNIEYVTIFLSTDEELDTEVVGVVI